VAGTPMASRRIILRGSAAVALLALLGLVAALSPSVALLLAPALVLFAALVLEVFPGERTLVRARARRLRRQVVRAPRSLPRPVVATLVRPAGRTLAFALAMRPPPAAPASR